MFSRFTGQTSLATRNRPVRSLHQSPFRGESRNRPKIDVKVNENSYKIYFFTDFLTRQCDLQGPLRDQQEDLFVGSEDRRKEIQRTLDVRGRIEDGQCCG